MKKLKNKIFGTIWIILTLFVLTILGIFNFQNYNSSKNEIEKNLLRVNSERNTTVKKDNFFPSGKDNNIDWQFDKENPKRFVDATIYTVLLDNDNNILEIISHTEDGSINESIPNIVSQIVSTNVQDTVHIGNLYFETFSYNYNAHNFITIIDNSDLKNNLRSYFRISLFLFLLAELVIVIIAQVLSNWLIKPVIESFDKQKQFIADASHELKTPLSVIMASAEAMEDYPNNSRWLNNIKDESERMSKLITNLLDLAKIENEENYKVYEMTNFSKLVEMTILPLESLTYEKNIKLTYNIEPNISLKCNSSEMRELLNILLDNAIKHSCQKGKITVNLKKNKNSVVLEVINKGKPIPKEEEDKIFERFYRIDKSRTRHNNSYGLGLAIAKSIVENHGGHISASSQEGFTTFTVFLKNKEH